MRVSTATLDSSGRPCGRWLLLVAAAAAAEPRPPLPRPLRGARTSTAHPARRRWSLDRGGSNRSRRTCRTLNAGCCAFPSALAEQATLPRRPRRRASTRARAAERAARLAALVLVERSARPISRSRRRTSERSPRKSCAAPSPTAGRRCERARARSRGRSRARSLPGLASARRERSTQPARQRANFLRAGVRLCVPRLSLGPRGRTAHPRRASQRTQFEPKSGTCARTELLSRHVVTMTRGRRVELTPTGGETAGAAHFRASCPTSRPPRRRRRRLRLRLAHRRRRRRVRRRVRRLTRRRRRASRRQLFTKGVEGLSYARWSPAPRWRRPK